jgi:Asp-tRNA(Asn)/Glu-tRNA(Gln) amidotransferase A subunit family amidase
MQGRRAFLEYCATIGVGSAVLPKVLWESLGAGRDITVETIACAEEIAGIALTPEQREMMLENLRRQQRAQAALHEIPVENALQPAFYFDPVPPGKELPARLLARRTAERRERQVVMAMPQSVEELAFATIGELSSLVRERRVRSRELTEMYLSRLERFDPRLHAVISLTSDRARAQAAAMDEEIARGRYRGPLHGIPWGAKDLLAVRGYPTTWGAPPFREQVFEEDATVVRRLDDAGAVLVAKLTLGELAMGDVWFGEMTRNPWYPEQGSSGSSAGAGATVAAGLVGFAIGSETLGSISSPSTRNGVTGLRPTFGRVPRTGAMALSWSMDKIGPMCRAAEDCALVLEALNGPDGQDRSVKDVPFTWDASLDPRRLRVGYFQKAFEGPERDANDSTRLLRPAKGSDDAALATLRGLGFELIPVEPPEFSTQALSLILTAEAGAAFEELTLSKRVDELVQQGAGAWPNSFRAAQFIPAVDYINASRVRTRLMEQWWDLFRQVDVIVTPTFGTNQLLASNLTGYPAVILPHGFVEGPLLRRPVTPADSVAAGRPRPQVPASLTFLGGLFDEARLVTVASAFQGATDWHRRRPPGLD